MSKRDHVLYLYDILDSINRIDSYILGMEKESFINSQLVSDAVIRNMEIIGEAAKNLSPEIKDKINTIPWKSVIGFRNIVIHEYFYVDLSNVWHILKGQLPGLKEAVELYLKENPAGNPDLFNN